MLRKFSVFLTLIVIFSSFCPTILAAEDNSAIKVLYENEHVEFKAEPFFQDGVLMVEFLSFVRLVAQESGSSMSKNKNRIEGKIGDDFIYYFEVDSNMAIINHEKKVLPVTPKIINHYIYIPLEFFAREVGLYYQWEPSTNTAKLFYPTVDMLIEAIEAADLSKMTYSGITKNGQMHGKGKLYAGDKLWYEGNFENGKPSGTGGFYYNEKPFYEGEIENGLPKGVGTFYNHSGMVMYRGEHDKGVLDGFGQTFYTRSSNYYMNYEGQFKNGIRNGQGKLYSGENILWYEGGWKDGQFHGTGKIYRNGKLYIEGKFINHDQYGYGKEYHFSDGSLKYEGNYEQDKYHGHGTLYYRNGYKYEGTFIDGEIGDGNLYVKNTANKYIKVSFVENGKGTKLYKNGDLYIGELNNGKRTNQGKYYNNDGELIYEGKFVNDQYNGEGTLYEEDKVKFLGVFKNGELVKGKKYHYGELVYDGNFKNFEYTEGKEYVNGKLNYEGAFTNGLYEGKGKLYNKAGKLVFEGSFLNNSIQGKGTILYQNGYRFVGEFSNGYISEGNYFDNKGSIVTETQNGTGALFFSDGVYIGDIKNGEQHGSGTYYQNSGRKLKGEFVNGYAEGFVEYYNSDGTLYYKGYMKEDTLHGFGIIYDKQGREVVKGEFNYGVIILGDLSITKKEIEIIPSIIKSMTVTKKERYNLYEDKFSPHEQSLYIKLSSQEAYNLFMTLTHAGKTRLINSYVQQHWEEGVQRYFIRVEYLDDVLVYTWATQGMSEDYMGLEYIVD